MEFLIESKSIFFSAHALDTAQLVCGHSQIQVGLRLASLVSYGLNGLSGHLDDSSCTDFTERDGTVWYQVARQADTCGNILTVRISLLIVGSNLT